MKGLTIIDFRVALLLTIILNVVRVKSIAEELHRMAIDGETIDGIFKPSIGGLLGSGYFGTTYKGEFLPCDNMEVAMKFSPHWSSDNAKTEYEMYTYLNAINRPDIKINGIPTIYYYGHWNNYTIMAMTLLDSEYQKKVENFNINKSDLFIILREYVRIIKYVHSRGIIQHDSKIQNIIIQNGRGFIYDFGTSSDMTQGTRTENIAAAKEDLQNFLLSLFEFVQLRSKWHWLGFGDKDAYRMIDSFSFARYLTADAKSNTRNKFHGLRKVFVEFAKHAFDINSAGTKDANGNWIPFYDQLYRVICEEMKETSSISFISSIPDPFGELDWPRLPVNYALFEKMYADRIEAARKKIKEAKTGIEKTEPSNSSGWWPKKFWR